MHRVFEDTESEYEENNGFAHFKLSELLNSKVTLVDKPDDGETDSIKLLQKIVNTLEQGMARRSLLQADFAIDLSLYDEVYEDALKAIAFIVFGEDGLNWIEYYVNERINPDDGSVNYLEDRHLNKYYLNNATDLWHLIKNTTDTPTPKERKTEKDKKHTD